ncbi:hypothetical protein K8Q94_01905 [Candidatus Nomurabacteria bacterium]|nr:hypothetical protein [Candidatus Nomurabacteria bacterium]
MKKNNTEILLLIFSYFFTFVISSFFVFWTFIPFIQTVTFSKHFTSILLNDPLKFTKKTFIFSPDTYIQGQIRYTMVNEFFNKYKNGDLTQSNPLFDFAIDKFSDYLDKEKPAYYNYYLSLGKAYDQNGYLYNDKSMYEKALKYYKQAFALAPERQDVIYAYAFNLSNRGMKKEAIDLLNNSLNKNNSIPEGHYYMGLVLATTSPEKYKSALDYFEFSLNQNVNPSPDFTKKIYERFFNTFYLEGDKDNFYIATKRMKILEPEQIEVLNKVTDYIEKYNSIPLINIIAE